MKFLTRSIGLSNRITNSPDHRLASRKFLSFWPGSRTFPITDCHLDHCMERWNERIGMRKWSVSYQPPGKQTTDSCTHFFAKLSFASHSYFELPQGGNCPEYDFASFQSISRSKSFRLDNRLKPLSSSTSATKFFKPCIQSLNVAADCELFLALCSYILWCISKKFHSQWELLWQSMFSVDIEDIKLVHLDFPSHPSHCAIDFDLWTSPLTHLRTRSIGLSNRITNSPDHRLASRKFLSFWPGSRTFPITDCHLDHCMERWNERIGMRKRSVSYQPPLEKALILLRGNCFKCGALLVHGVLSVCWRSCRGCLSWTILVSFACLCYTTGHFVRLVRQNLF